MRFEKVSRDEWNRTATELGKPCEAYDDIKLPKQATEHSMAVDIFAPYDIVLPPNSSVKIPTGIRWICDGMFDTDLGLVICPRSGLGFKYGIRLRNTLGIIDADYYMSDNEGHIILALENPSDEMVEIKAGKGMVQGFCIGYIIPEGAESFEARNGGMGSTDSKN